MPCHDCTGDIVPGKTVNVPRRPAQPVFYFTRRLSRASMSKIRGGGLDTLPLGSRWRAVRTERSNDAAAKSRCGGQAAGFSKAGGVSGTRRFGIGSAANIFWRSEKPIPPSLVARDARALSVDNPVLPNA